MLRRHLPSIAICPAPWSAYFWRWRWPWAFTCTTSVVFRHRRLITTWSKFRQRTSIRARSKRLTCNRRRRRWSKVHPQSQATTQLRARQRILQKARRRLPQRRAIQYNRKLKSERGRREKLRSHRQNRILFRSRNIREIPVRSARPKMYTLCKLFYKGCCFGRT